MLKERNLFYLNLIIFAQKDEFILPQFYYLYNSFHWQGGTVTSMGYAAEEKKLNLNLPFYDQRIHKLLSQMPENFGRGLEIKPTKYPLKWIFNNKIDLSPLFSGVLYCYSYTVDKFFGNNLLVASFTRRSVAVSILFSSSVIKS